MNNKIKCPYCGRTHYVAPHLNVICPCGAKYYIHLCEWWSRGAITKVQTNADRIRAMTDEELAKWLADIWDCNECSEHERLGDCPLLSDEQCDQKCEQHCLEWLKQQM